jgi:hypothetical protein
MVALGRGVYHQDSTPSGRNSTADNRRDYREDGHAQQCEMFV